MDTDDTLNTTLTTLIQALTELQKRLSQPTAAVDEDTLHDLVVNKLPNAIDDHLSQRHNLRHVADMVSEQIDTDDIRIEIQDNLDVSSAISDWFGSEFTPSDYDLVTDDRCESIVEDKLSEKLDGMVATAVRDFSVTAEFRQAVRAAMVQLLSGEKA